jgi:hypothetical protein
MRFTPRRWSEVGLLAGDCAAARRSTPVDRGPSSGAESHAPSKEHDDAGTGTTSVSASPTLPTTSAAGTLLVAVVLTNGASPSRTPSGWTRAANSTAIGDVAQIWYQANNAGGVTTVTFGAGVGTLMTRS